DVPCLSSDFGTAFLAGNRSADNGAILHGNRGNLSPLAAVLLADGLTRKLAVAEHKPAANIRGFHYPTQLFSQVRRNPVTVMQSVFADYEFALRIENHEIGIVPRCNSAFPGMAAS